MPASNWHKLAVLLLWLMLSLITGHPGIGMLYTVLILLAVVLTLPLWTPALVVLVNVVAYLSTRRKHP